MNQSFETKLLLTILVIETAGLLYLLRNSDIYSQTNLKVEMGKHYSFLIDDERFPVPARVGQTIMIKVKNKGQNLLTLPSGRTIVNHEKAQDGMAKVTQPRFLFYYDSPDRLHPLLKQENLITLKRGGDWDTIVSVLHWTRRQFTMGHPKEYPSQNAAELLPLLRSGKIEGFCAHYCYVLVQSLQALGYYARYLTIQGHEVAEVWVPQLNKWVCLDPTNDIYFEDSTGHKLSALEIHDARQVIIRSPSFKGDVKDVLVGYRNLYYLLRNDLVSHPINIYDLGKYRCRAIFRTSDLGEVTPGDLFTVFPEELYFPPQTQSIHSS